MSKLILASLVLGLSVSVPQPSIAADADSVSAECATWRSLPPEMRENIPAPPNCTHEELDPFPL